MRDEATTELKCRSGLGQVYFDCTVGLGGHTEAILEQTAPDGVVIGIDRDRDALADAAARLKGYGNRVRFEHGAFESLSDVAERQAIREVSGILFDLGVSSLQFDRPERGFSFRAPGPLDMRMDRSEPNTAADWLADCSESELADVLYQYGGERRARRIARAIVWHQKEVGPIAQCETLEAIIWKATPPNMRHGSIHPATRAFQAIRMVVNREMEQLAGGLAAAIPLLGCGGRLVVISFHSGEDACVKHTFRQGVKGAAAERSYTLPYKKPLCATPAEVARNPRARSAKMRVLERAV
jgi:16S rRNA (cytosine1402-N4)-methyltransferase